jgi:hypothetical protein
VTAQQQQQLVPSRATACTIWRKQLLAYSLHKVMMQN